MLRRIMGKQSWKSFVGIAVLLWAIFCLSTDNPLWGAEEKKSEAQKEPEAERERAIKESVLQARGKMVSGENATRKEEANVPPKETEKTSTEEAPSFLLAENIRWEGGQDSASLEITGEEETLPAGEIDTSMDGTSVRWRPTQTLVVMRKKENTVESPFLQSVVFREDVAETKKLGLEAPYYALSEIILTFSTAVSYNATQDGAWIFIEFSATTKEAVPPGLEARVRPQQEIPMLASSSPADMLGTFYQAKETYEAYVTGGGKVGEDMKRMPAEKRPTGGIFNGKEGFPQDMTPVFKEAYPAFGTPEYWKRHIRGVLGQTFGYSSDFDGAYGAWGGTSCKRGALTLQPDMEVMYNGLGFGQPFYGQQKPTGSLDLGYKARRMFPMGNLLGFGDGGRFQTINWGGNYLPQKNYSLASQNTMDIFAGKTIGSSRGDWVRDPRQGYRMTNAASFNYRLSRRLLWKNGIGLQKTWSNAPSGRSRDASGFLSTGLEQILTRRLSIETAYGYRHIFKDTSPFANSGPQTKDKDFHSLSQDVRYKITSRLSLNGGPEFDAIDAKLFKFGGHVRLRYQWRPKDLFQIEYGNGLIEDGTGKLFSGLTASRNLNDTKITVFRGERYRINYTHKLETGDLSLSFGYLKTLPLSGYYGGQTTNDDGFSFQASWRRKLRGGLTWLELTYRLSTYRAKAADPQNTTDVSVKEHAVFFIVRNYFGEWEEMI